MTTHTNIRGKKIPTIENEERKFPPITKDQKKFRVLSYLQSKGEEPVSEFTLLKGITKHASSQSPKHTSFLRDLEDAKLIELVRVRNSVTSGYKISEKGKKLMNIIKLIKKISPHNPIFSLDLFHRTEAENKISENLDKDEGAGFKKIFDFDFDIPRETIIKRLKDIEAKTGKGIPEDVIDKQFENVAETEQEDHIKKIKEDLEYIFDCKF